MSMYGLVFGQDGGPQKRGRAILAILGFESFDSVGRYRDAWVEQGESGEPVIAIYTRNGGGNREECWRLEDDPRPATADSAGCDCPACMANHELPAHEYWIRGEDDDFDSTYRTEYFRVPPEFVEALRTVAQEPVDTDQRWLAAIDAIKQAGAS